MKKIFIVLTIAALGFAVSCKGKTVAEGEAAATDETTAEVAAPEPEKRPGRAIKTESDSLSYALAVGFGDYVKNMRENIGKDINVDMMIAAIRDVQKDKYSLTAMEAQQYANNYFNVILPEKNLKAGEEFLAKVEAETPGIQKTENGVLYQIIEQGSDVMATDSLSRDKVRVMYRGMLKNGREFDSSYAEGRDTAEFPLNGVIRGWGEGLKLIGEGGKIKLWIPTDLAYGKYPRGNMIGPNEPLVFDVELFKVIPYEEPAETATK